MKHKIVRAKNREERIVLAIISSVNLGRVLQVNHPEIADLCRQGASYSDIAKELELVEPGFALSLDNAARVVGFAIRGSRNDYNGRIPTYSGLLGLEETRRLAREQFVKSGTKLYASRKGLFAMTKEQLRRRSLNGAVSQGKVPWKERQNCDSYCVYSEEEFLERLASHDNYTHKTKGAVYGKPNNIMIAESLNEIYHGGRKVRTTMAIQRRLYQISIRNLD